MTDHLTTLLSRYPALAPCKAEIEGAYEILKSSFAAGGKLLICGNGGSAADAEHIVGELMKDFHRKRAVSAELAENLKAFPNGDELAQNLSGALPAISLCSHTALMTALLNDGDPTLVFAQQVCGFGCCGDVLLALSTSGNSKNVLQAAVTAKAKGMRVILISGEKKGAICPYADVTLNLPETDTFKVQELTLPVYHALCLMLEDHFFA